MCVCVFVWVGCAYYHCQYKNTNPLVDPTWKLCCAHKYFFFADAVSERDTYMIPPAFREVGQLMLQAVFQELEHHTDDHAHPPVADHQGLGAHTH